MSEPVNKTDVTEPTNEPEPARNEPDTPEPSQGGASTEELIKELETLRSLKKEVGNYRHRMKAAEKAAEDASKERDEALSLVEDMKEKVYEAKLLGAAAGKLADPYDALRFVEREGLDWNSEPAQFAEAIDALIRTKPYLASPTPDPDLGPRGDDAVSPKDDPNNWLRKRLQSGR